LAQIVFYLAVTESVSSDENNLGDIASNKQIGIRKFYDMNQNIFIGFTRKYNKIQFTFWRRKYDPEFECQDEYKLK